MRIKIVILILILQPLLMKSQNATATLGTITSCAGENVLVPVDVMDFYGVGAMTFYIGFDTNTAEFLSIENINPAIPGTISANSTNGQVGIAYSFTEPFDLSGEKLFDLSFTFLGGNSDLTFNQGTEIATVDLMIIPLDTYSGGIINSIQIIDQPEDVQSYPDHDVIFGITAQGDIIYQWQENTGNSWADLQNNSVYSGVNTDTLALNDISLSFNGYSYRCVVTANECIEISNVALLEVASVYPAATLGNISSCPNSQLLEPVNAADFFDVVDFSFNISFDTANLLFVSLENIYPALSSGSLIISLLENNPGISIHWSGDSPLTITDNKLFDLKFIYKSQNQEITFADGTYALNTFSNLINLSLTNGTVVPYSIPVITSQPQDQTVMENEEVSFTVGDNGADSYVWMESANGGNSWTDLSDVPPYYNTHTAVLTINPAYYYLNDHDYACRLSNANCSVTSLPATLTVDTLTYIQLPKEYSHTLVYPVPCTGVFHLKLQDDVEASVIRILNAYGIEFEKYTKYQLENDIMFDISSLPGGIFLLSIEGLSNGKSFSEQHKILKTK